MSLLNGTFLFTQTPLNKQFIRTAVIHFDKFSLKTQVPGLDTKHQFIYLNEDLVYIGGLLYARYIYTFTTHPLSGQDKPYVKFSNSLLYGTSNSKQCIQQHRGLFPIYLGQQNKALTLKATTNKEYLDALFELSGRDRLSFKIDDTTTRFVATIFKDHNNVIDFEQELKNQIFLQRNNYDKKTPTIPTDDGF